MRCELEIMIRVKKGFLYSNYCFRIEKKLFMYYSGSYFMYYSGDGQ